jgi:hypothetical protein
MDSHTTALGERQRIRMSSTPLLSQRARMPEAETRQARLSIFLGAAKASTGMVGKATQKPFPSPTCHLIKFGSFMI